MAKIFGLFGSMTGKLADVVMAVRNGEQVARKYQPIVFNPSTPAQVAQRAKMKLMSQLSAVMGDVIAIPRSGNVSSRNLFTKKNFALTRYSSAENQAEIELADVQLTAGVLPMPQVYSMVVGDNAITVQMPVGMVPADINKVVYLAFAKSADNSLEFLGSVVVESAGDGNNWEGNLPRSTQPLVIYAYGIRVNSDAARATFGNLVVLTAETIAKVITSRSLLESDVTFTKTSGREFPAANMAVNPAPSPETRTVKKWK